MDAPISPSFLDVGGQRFAMSGLGQPRSDLFCHHFKIA
jgi:hypothetical protein